MTDCAPVPLKLTVVGEDVVAFNAPAVTVNVLAMPSVEFAESCNDVPLMVTLKRLAVPLSDDVPVKVAVPAEAENVPPTKRPEAIVKFEVAVTEADAGIDSKLMLIVPAPEMLLAAPLIVIVPVLAVKLPVTDRLPVTVSETAVVTEPLIVRLSSEIPVPLIVFDAPDIINVPPDA